MRFACQSCGKAYNLPEEKIADKSNVKLKCRVCGAIVEVKRQGDVVAQMLDDTDSKRSRVSEAPSPMTSLGPEDMLTSMSADDGDDATQAIAVGDQVLSEGGSGDAAASALLGQVRSTLGQRGISPLPPPSPTGFSAPPTPPGFAPTPVPPPLSPEPTHRGEAPPPYRGEAPPPFRGEAPSAYRGDAGSPFRGEAPPLPSSAFGSNGGSPPPPLPSPLPGSPFPNGSNGAGARYGDMLALPDEPSPPPPIAPLPTAPVAAPAVSGPPGAAPSRGTPAVAASSMTMDGGFAGSSLEMPQAQPAADDTTRKMLAALATGILIGFIIARLFF